MTEELKQLQVLFLPWAGLREELSIGSIKFWPWDIGKISDSDIGGHLDRCFRCYVDQHRSPVDTIIVCTKDSYDRFHYSEEEQQDIRSAVDCLTFSVIATATKNAVCSNNRSMAPPSSDRYQVESLNFQPGQDTIGIWAGNVRDLGWEIDNLIFMKPWCIGGWFGSPNNELVEGFNKLFESSSDPEIRERILRSLEWFRLAHTEVDQISDFSKIVMMSTAFEILLEFSEREQTKYFAHYINDHLSTKDSIIDTRADSSGNDFRGSLAAWWAWDFYKLRSSIVHGDAINPESLRYKDWISQLIVADLVFWQCIILKMFENNIIGDYIRQKAQELAQFSKDPVEEFEKTLLFNYTTFGYNFASVHNALGWLQ